MIRNPRTLAEAKARALDTMDAQRPYGPEEAVMTEIGDLLGRQYEQTFADALSLKLKKVGDQYMMNSERAFELQQERPMSWDTKFADEAEEAECDFAADWLLECERLERPFTHPAVWEAA